MSKILSVIDNLHKLRPLPRDRGDRCLILWWGSLRRAGATAGDCMAVANMALGLKSRGIQTEIAAFIDLKIPEVPTVHPMAAQPRRYKAACFVCGPLRSSRKILNLMDRYESCHRIAAGVGIIEEEQEILKRFDKLVPRDGAIHSTFDLALASPWRETFPFPKKMPHLVYTCFRGSQSSIGLNGYSLHQRAEPVLEIAAKKAAKDGDVRKIDTVARTPESIRNVLEQFSKARLVLTTRLHGSLLSLEHSVPFIAVDQINGGHKVTEVLSKIGWPYVFHAEEVTLSEIENAIIDVTEPNFPIKINEYRSLAIDKANIALEKACDAVEGFY
ncbi:MAG TPA: polysaccharide pyruvyl transferase family protein [Acidobacteriota bacterium]